MCDQDNTAHEAKATSMSTMPRARTQAAGASERRTDSWLLGMRRFSLILPSDATGQPPKSYFELTFFGAIPCPEDPNRLTGLFAPNRTI